MCDIELVLKFKNFLELSNYYKNIDFTQTALELNHTHTSSVMNQISS